MATYTCANPGGYGGRQHCELRSVLAATDVPRQVIWRRLDRILPIAHAEGLVEDVAVHMIDGAGHLPHMERSSEVNRLIANLVSSA